MRRIRLITVLTALVAVFVVLGVAPMAQALSAPHTGKQVVFVAKRQLGIRYVWGGADRRGFDSSGLTTYVYGKLGVTLRHGATDQARLGRRVRLSHLRPGDLVFWGHPKYYYHVAIYVGHGRVIDAPHTGAVVSYGGLKGASTARRLLPAK